MRSTLVKVAALAGLVFALFAELARAAALPGLGGWALPAAVVCLAVAAVLAWVL